MDISVIVPIYGVEEYIENSLRSLFNQTKTDDVEFILINDCTKDMSMSLARNVISDYSSLNIVIVDHEVNKGVAAARQNGLALASGDYVIQFDPDDWCESNMLKELYSCALDNNADIVICDYYISNVNKNKYCQQLITSNNGLKCVEDMFKRRFNYGVWNKLVKRSLYVDNDISIVPNINMGEDLIFCAKILCYAQNVVSLPKAYLHYVQNPNSLTATTKISLKSIESIFAALSEIEGFYRDRGFLDILQASLNYRKVMVKYQLLMGVEKSLQKEYIKIFPEANGFIMKQTALSFMKRVIVYLSTMGVLLPLNIVKSISKFK
ncbi:MAG: glycosyltransferase [Rikenellaceae bacterium]